MVLGCILSVSIATSARAVVGGGSNEVSEASEVADGCPSRQANNYDNEDDLRGGSS